MSFRSRPDHSPRIDVDPWPDDTPLLPLGLLWNGAEDKTPINNILHRESLRDGPGNDPWLLLVEGTQRVLAISPTPQFILARGDRRRRCVGQTAN